MTFTYFLQGASAEFPLIGYFWRPVVMSSDVQNYIGRSLCPGIITERFQREFYLDRNQYYRNLQQRNGWLKTYCSELDASFPALSLVAWNRSCTSNSRSVRTEYGNRSKPRDAWHRQTWSFIGSVWDGNLSIDQHRATPVSIGYQAPEWTLASFFGYTLLTHKQAQVR